MIGLVRRALVIGRERGLRELGSRLLRYAEANVVHPVTLVGPYALYLRHRDLPYSRPLLRLYLRAYQRLGSVEFDTENPLTLLRVDPSEIVHDSPNEPPVYWGRIEGGDWDLDADRFADRAVPRSLRLHYEEGVAWAQTPLRQYFDEKMAEGGAWGYTSSDEFPDRVDDIEALVESIREHGYRTQRDLDSTETTESFPPVLDEVTVDIGRNGEYMYRNLGQHRIAVAALLGVDEIPVLVGTKHAEYAES